MILFMNPDLFGETFTEDFTGKSSVGGQKITTFTTLADKKNKYAKIARMVHPEDGINKHRTKIYVRRWANGSIVNEIIQDDRNKYDTDIYVVAVPFMKGNLLPVQKSYDYRIYRGTTIDLGETRYYGDDEETKIPYDSIAYIMLTPNLTLFDKKNSYYHDTMRLDVVTRFTAEDGTTTGVSWILEMHEDRTADFYYEISENSDFGDADEDPKFPLFPIYIPPVKVDPKKMDGDEASSANSASAEAAARPSQSAGERTERKARKSDRRNNPNQQPKNNKGGTRKDRKKEKKREARNSCGGSLREALNRAYSSENSR